MPPIKNASKTVTKPASAKSASVKAPPKTTLKTKSEAKTVSAAKTVSPKSAPAKTAAKAQQASRTSPKAPVSKTSPAKATTITAAAKTTSNPKIQAKSVARTQTLTKAVEKPAPIKLEKKAAAPIAIKPVAPKVAAAVPKIAPKIALKPAAVVPAAAKPAVAPVQRAMPAAATKPAQPKLTAPMAPQAQKPAAPAPAAADTSPKKPVNSRHGFKTNESVVYPAHGVGRIIGIEEQEIAGITLELFVIQFEKDKMTLRVPTSKLASVGMRKLAEDGIVSKAMETLKGKARIKRTMWSRRAQEYEAKINSGDLVSIAEVVRDLYRSEAQPEQSYSERQLYEAALDRMAREIAAVDKVDERGAMQRITEVLSKSARGRRAAEEEAQAGAEVKAA